MRCTSIVRSGMRETGFETGDELGGQARRSCGKDEIPQDGLHGTVED